MDAALVVAAIIGVFFTIGLLVGALVVNALPALRDRRSGRNGRRGPEGGSVQQNYDDGGPGAHPGWQRAEPDDRPRWPGDADGGDPGR